MSQIRGLWTMGAAAALALSLSAAGCDSLDEPGTGDGGMGDAGGSGDAGVPPQGLATFASSGEEVTLDFSDGDEQYMIVPYSVSKEVSATISYSVSEGGAAEPRAKLGGRGPSGHIGRGQAGRARSALMPYWRARLSTERWRRELMVRESRRLRKLPQRAAYQATECSVSADCGSDEVCHKGACASEVVLSTEAFGGSGEITVAVQAKNSVAAVLVDKTLKVNAAGILDPILNAFTQVIYPRDVALFGNPPLSASDGRLSADRNGDGITWLVFTNEGRLSGEAVGFFVPTDFGQDAQSNEADILYLKPPDEGSDLERVYETLAHELEHLLNYASKAYRAVQNGQQATIEALWLDEGLGHFAEGACGYGRGNVDLLNDELFPVFDATSMFAVDGVDDSLSMRGMSMMFVRYLFEQRGGVTYAEDSAAITDTGGAAWLQSILASGEQGTDVIDLTYGDFRRAFGNWMVAVALDGRLVDGAPVTTYPGYRYAPITTDPVTGNELGLRVRGTMLGTGPEPVTLEPPLEIDISGQLPYSGVVQSGSGQFLTFTGEGQSVPVTVSSEDSSVRYVAIRLAE